MIYCIVALSIFAISPTSIRAMYLESNEVTAYRHPCKKRKIEIDGNTAYKLWLQKKLFSHDKEGTISPEGLCYFMEYLPSEILCMIAQCMLDDTHVLHAYVLLDKIYKTPIVHHYHYKKPRLYEAYNAITRSMEYTIKCESQCGHKEIFTTGERLNFDEKTDKNNAIIAYIQRACQKFRLSKPNFIYKESDTIITGHNNCKTYQWNLPHKENAVLKKIYNSISFKTICALMPFLTGQQRELNEKYEQEAKEIFLTFKKNRYRS